jgi:hypothetical protein
MDGTMQLFVSGAQDLNGDILPLTNAAAFTVQATPPPAPVLSLVASNSSSVTVGWPGYNAPADLAGFRVYLQTTNYTSLAGVPVYTGLGAGARSYDFGVDGGHDAAGFSAQFPAAAGGHSGGRRRGGERGGILEQLQSPGPARFRGVFRVL